MTTPEKEWAILKPCEICGVLTSTYTGGPPLTPEEQAEVRAYDESFRAPNGSPIYHTGHMPTRLMRLPIHWYCQTHLPNPTVP